MGVNEVSGSKRKLEKLLKAKEVIIVREVKSNTSACTNTTYSLYSFHLNLPFSSPKHAILISYTYHLLI